MVFFFLNPWKHVIMFYLYVVTKNELKFTGNEPQNDKNNCFKITQYKIQCEKIMLFFLLDTQTICLFSKAVVIDLGYVEKKTPKPKLNPPKIARVKSQINIISTKLYFHISIQLFCVYFQVSHICFPSFRACVSIKLKKTF